MGNRSRDPRPEPSSEKGGTRVSHEGDVGTTQRDLEW